uniref:Uncharacterized protein n=1 Tax=Medicago truncatula TaxID=3880 RepID=I3SWJ2_MEDTR|nr:unknown [Medicago truncatula]
MTNFIGCLNILTWRQFSQLCSSSEYSFHVITNFNVANAVPNHHQPIKQFSKFGSTSLGHASLHLSRICNSQ